MKSSVLLICFNRLDFVQDQIEQIPQDRKLYILQDGLGDKIQYSYEWRQLRNYLLRNYAEDSRVTLMLREKNLGGADGIPNAIDWALQNEDRIIVLEDDCLDGMEFYKFCDYHLQNNYDEDLVFISGNNFIDDKVKLNHNLILSYPHCWGWAITKHNWLRIRPFRDANGTWVSEYGYTKLQRRLRLIATIRKKKYLNSLEKLYWYFIFDKLLTQVKYHWDYTLQLHMWLHDLYSIIPVKNLVTNIGADNRSLNIKRVTNNHFKEITVNESDLRILLSPITKKHYDLKLDKINQWTVYGGTLRMIYHRLGIFKNPIKFLYFKVREYLV